MRKELSILIVTHNQSCVPLVVELCQQCRATATLKYEICVIDNHSTLLESKKENQRINTLPHCFFKETKKTTKEYKLYNSLIQHAHYNNILCLKASFSVSNHNYIRNYIYSSPYTIIHGGLHYTSHDKHRKHNLNYLYLRRLEHHNTALHRKRNPYTKINFFNTLFPRTLLVENSIDNFYSEEGINNILLGKRLEMQHHIVSHIDNPMTISSFYSNSLFIDKTEKELYRIYQQRHLLSDFNRIIQITQHLQHYHLARLLSKIGRRYCPLLRKNLISQHPFLCIYDIYRLLFYITIVYQK